MISKIMNMKTGDFFNKLLNGVAFGIVIGLIPNAILGEVFKALLNVSPIFKTALFVVQTVQSAVPVLIGCLVAVQFAFTPIEVATLGATTFISSGVVKTITVNNASVVQLAGIGDLINIILVATVATLVIQSLKGRLGSLAMILTPLIVVTVIGSLGYMALPYVSEISKAIGAAIKNFTQLQPLLMSILISTSFAVIIISPLSTVAIGIAIGLAGLSSGAANMGIATCAMTLVCGSIQVKNKMGVTLAVFFGSMKLFIPNWMRHPIINIPIILNGILGGFIAYFFNIQGTPQSSGFGFSGLVGPIAAYKYMTQDPIVRLLLLFIAYFVLTTLGAMLIDFVCVKVLKLYKHEIYEFK